VVVPSLSEGFLNTILEARVNSKSVIAFDVGGNKEAIRNKEIGISVSAKGSGKLADGLLTVLNGKKMGAKKIKILFLIDRLLPGGTEKQLLFLTESLPRASFEPVIGVLQETEFQKGLKLATPIVDFGWHGLPIIKTFSLTWKLRKYIKSERFDIVQTHLNEAGIYGGVALRLIRNRPYLIGTRRDLYHWINEELIEFQLYRITGKFADKILVNSGSVFAKCQKLEHVPSEKIVLIQNGVEIDRFNGVSAENAKKKIGLDGHYPVVGVVGNWRPVKGLIPFLDAAYQVFREYPCALFVLAGFGEQKDELIKHSQELGIEGRVILLESPPNINEVISALDIAVQPSLSESFSNVLLEYMAASKAIVATRVGDAEGAIEDGHEGLLVHPGNAEELSEGILFLCRNRSKADEMGKRAREKVERKWQASKILATYVRFYQELVERRNGSK
jgi:glycosyltransferase involved in cell wall biosynthesis